MRVLFKQDEIIVLHDTENEGNLELLEEYAQDPDVIGEVPSENGARNVANTGSETSNIYNSLADSITNNIYNAAMDGIVGIIPIVLPVAGAIIGLELIFYIFKALLGVHLTPGAINPDGTYITWEERLEAYGEGEEDLFAAYFPDESVTKVVESSGDSGEDYYMEEFDDEEIF